MPQPIPQSMRNSTEFNEIQSSAPESGSEISDMVGSNELGIKVESLLQENNEDPPVLPDSQSPSSQKLNFKSYEKAKAVAPCAKGNYIQVTIFLKNCSNNSKLGKNSKRY
ncbi:hypothetical protein O181_075343 [Austropuccinia psidii MF-1]|uniref:Uncharacterized protein n=1 Tax=Austropuccinia psidii MF-1 TaxID=1389203 RepID=A0A9Q3IBT7_9BASI|nr:hypothetical protein [Austropuccinia psidii MF-1]